MPYEIHFDKPPAGYALSGARDGEHALIQTFEFTSTEDGQHFILRLEGFPDEVLQRLQPQRQITPSQVDHLLAIIDPDGRSTVYVNELKLVGTIRPNRPIAKGELIGKDDLVEITALDVGVEIPPSAGFVLLFSLGWRKALIYDFGPLTPERQPRSFDYTVLFGQAYCHLLFQERFSLSDADWDALFKAKWFPFVTLPDRLIKSSIEHVRMGWGLSEILPQVIEEVNRRLPTMIDDWNRHPSFASHIEVLSRAAERFSAKDFVSCVAILYPRIEGILRTHHASTGVPEKANQGNLVKTAVAGRIDKERSLLLPHRFAAYLTNVYFADFNPTAREIDVSRHSVAHGVATPSRFDEASAVIALLVVQNLLYSLEPPKTSSGDSAIG